MKNNSLDEKYEMALIRANRFDVFKAIEKVNKRREKKRNSVCDELGFDIAQASDCFDKSEWQPSVYRPSRKIK